MLAQANPAHPVSSTPAPPQAARAKLAWPIVAFFVILLMPDTLAISIGPAKVTSYRALMLVLVPFIAARLGSSKTIKLGLPDALIAAFSVWTVLCIFINFDGGPATERAGQFLLESSCAYFLARAYITSLDDLYALIRPIFLITAISCAFAVPEAITHKKPLIDLTTAITGVQPKLYVEGADIRMGLRRAQASFEHPILFGLFCASCISLLWYTEAKIIPRLGKLAVVVVAVIVSLSSGPILAMMVQFIMIAGETATRRMKNRVAIAIGVVVVAALLVDATTNSGPFGIIINYLTFQQTSSYNRVLIWDYGLRNINVHPFFGMIPEDWERAPWMKVSTDNFWIYTGLLSGYVGWGLLSASVLSILYRFARIPDKLLSLRHIQFRRGWSIMIAAFLFTGFSVAFFGKLQPYFYFLLGLGAVGAVAYAADAQRSAPAKAARRAAANMARP